MPKLETFLGQQFFIRISPIKLYVQFWFSSGFEGILFNKLVTSAKYCALQMIVKRLEICWDNMFAHFFS